MKLNLKVSLILMLLSSIIATNSFSQSNNNEFIGDYKNSSNTLFAQVYKNSNGEYKINVVSDLISREKPKTILSGELQNNNTLNINGNGWSGKIEKGILTAKNEKESVLMKSFKRSSLTINAKPPKGAIVLFNGKNLDLWQKAGPKDWLKGTGPADNWAILPGGILEVTTQPSGEHLSILTKQSFGDLKLHIEFRLLGGKTNGGIYFMSRYELNVKDAYGNVGESPIAFGNVSKPKDLYPDVNVAFPPMEWQTFDVDFRAPRFDKTGMTKIENARITVVHNGITTLKDVEIEELKGATAKLGEAGIGPLYLQDHGNAYQFRNIWVIDKTLKGTEKYQTAIAVSDDVLKESNTKIESKGKKSGGNKSGGNKSGGKKKVNGSESITEIESKEKKSGGNKSGGKKKVDNLESDQITEKVKTGSKSGGKKKTGTSITEGETPKVEEPAKSVVKKGGSSKKKADPTYMGERNPAYANIKVSLIADPSGKPAKTAGFIHPGVLVNELQLSEIKRRVAAGIEPQKTAFETLKNSPFAALNYKAQPRDTVSCGPYSNPNLGCKDEQNDSAAAYSQALMYYITGNKAYAENAIQIMNAWSTNLVGGHNYANGPVQAAWSGSVWPRAAEIIRYTYNEWSDADVAKFQNMLRTQYLPSLVQGDCENGNKELAMAEAIINIGVFNDDKAVFNFGLEMWRKRTPAYIYLKIDGATPIEPPGCGPAIWSNKGLMPELVDGLLQETARDAHHPGMAFASIANAAETARQQGVDLYQEEGKRIMAAMEFYSKHLKPNDVTVPENLIFSKLKTWDIAYNHFNKRLGINLPYTTKVIPTLRPTGTDHHMVWETLTHGDMGDVGLPPVEKK
jgi:hypothetical protein